MAFWKSPDAHGSSVATNPRTLSLCKCLDLAAPSKESTYSTDQRQGIMRWRLKRAVIASDEGGSASFEPRLSLATNAVAPRLTAVGPCVDRVFASF